jgi:hypothetical protein
MKCDSALLSAYLDNELKADERSEVELHVTSCPDCAGKLEKYRRLRFELRDEPLRRAPAQLRSDIRIRIHGRERQRWMRWIPLAIGAPVTMVGVVVSAVAMAPRSDSSPRLAVTATSPMNGATRVAPNGTVEMWFDRELAPGTADVAVSVDPPVPVRVSIEGNALRINPDMAFDPGQTYTVAVESVVDVDGRRLKTPAVISFVTGSSALANSSDLGSPRGVPLEGAVATSESDSRRLGEVSLPSIASVPAAVTGASIEAVSLTQTRKWPVARTTSGKPIIEASPPVALVGEHLGALQAPYQTVRVQEQAFQGGVMVRLGDSAQMLVLRRNTGIWEAVPQPPSTVDGQAESSLPPPPGALAPNGAFAAVWESVPSVRTALGWAVYEPRVSSAVIQQREHGTVIALGRMAYLLRSDGTWNVVPISKTASVANQP